MNKIPLWGKIVGGCSILLVLFLIIAGCSAVVFVASNGSPEKEPTASPETTTSEPETQEPTTEPETTVPEEPEVDTTGGINTCIPDQDQAMAEVVASYTSADVTIYTDQVYVVSEYADMDSFYVVAGSDAGLIMIYVEGVNGDEPMAYAANEVAYQYTMLPSPEEVGSDPIDETSDTFKVAEGCIS